MMNPKAWLNGASWLPVCQPTSPDASCSFKGCASAKNRNMGRSPRSAAMVPGLFPGQPLPTCKMEPIHRWIGFKSARNYGIETSPSTVSMGFLWPPVCSPWSLAIEHRGSSPMRYQTHGFWVHQQATSPSQQCMKLISGELPSWHILFPMHLMTPYPTIFQLSWSFSCVAPSELLLLVK